MRKEATLEQWNELYNVAIRIKELRSWEEEENALVSVFI